MRFFHLAVAIVMVVAILSQPLKGETWVVLAKPYYEVIGTFELERGGELNIDVDTRDQCLKLFEITETVPVDLKQVIGVSMIIDDNKESVTITIDKAEIKEGFADQKYRYDLLGTGFKAVSKVPL